MSDIYAVSRQRHAERAWSKSADFTWARPQQIVAVALQEAPQLMMSLPLGFARYEGRYLFAVLLGLRPGESLMVGPDGRWLAPHVPVLLQHYPFRLLRNPEGAHVLGVDEAGLPLDTTGGSPFFDENGAPAAELTTILDQLIQGDKARQQASQTAELLNQHELLEPWDLQVREEGGMFRVEGLYRINETKLNELSAESLLALRNTGALLMAYCQLLSMQHIQTLGRVAVAVAAAQQQTAVSSTEALNEHGTISFANL